LAYTESNRSDFPRRELEGDRDFVGTGFYSKTSSHGGREVTLIETETVEALFHGVFKAAGERLGTSLWRTSKSSRLRLGRRISRLPSAYRPIRAPGREADCGDIVPSVS